MTIFDTDWCLLRASYQAVIGILGYARMRGVPINASAWCEFGNCIYAKDGELHLGVGQVPGTKLLDYDKFRKMCDLFAGK